MLLQHGADVECTNIVGFTPLLAAVEMEDAEMIDILLRYGESTLSLLTASYVTSSLQCPNSVLRCGYV